MERRAEVPVLVIQGGDDHAVPRELLEVPGGHGLTAEGLEVLSGWISSV